jgi:hypothetical protein
MKDGQGEDCHKIANRREDCQQGKVGNLATLPKRRRITKP